MKQILIDATLFYYQILKSPYGIRAMNYLERERGLFHHTIEKYSLGTSVSLYGLYSHLIDCGHKHGDIVNTRLVKMEEDKFLFKDCFYNCITMPIFYKGIPAHMTSRYLNGRDKTDKGNEGMRHKHLAGSMDYLYNGDLLSTDNEYIVLSESPIDCMTLLQSGVPAIASFGSLKSSSMRFFKEDQEVIILFDNDKDKSKGLSSALGAAKLLYKRKGIIPKIATLPVVGDINEMWMSCKKDFKDRILVTLERAKCYSTFRHYDNVRNSIERSKQREDNHIQKNELFRKAKQIPILEVIKEYIEVEDMGNSFRSICPFHEDKKTKSLFIYPETNTFYCFGSGCRKFGDVIEFVKTIEGIQFEDVLIKLDRR